MQIHTMSTQFSSQCHSVLLCLGSLSCLTHDRGRVCVHDRGHIRMCCDLLCCNTMCLNCLECMHTSPYAEKNGMPYVFCTHTPNYVSHPWISPSHFPYTRLPSDRLFFSMSRAVAAIEQVCQCRACPTMGSTGHQRTSYQTCSNPNFRAWWLSRLQKPFKPWTGTTQGMKIRKI